MTADNVQICFITGGSNVHAIRLITQVFIRWKMFLDRSMASTMAESPHQAGGRSQQRPVLHLLHSSQRYQRERRRIVDAIASHSNEPSRILQHLDNQELVFWVNSSNRHNLPRAPEIGHQKNLPHASTARRNIPSRFTTAFNASASDMSSVTSGTVPSSATPHVFSDMSK